jgi:hypothetical protein
VVSMGIRQVNSTGETFNQTISPRSPGDSGLRREWRVFKGGPSPKKSAPENDVQASERGV